MSDIRTALITDSKLLLTSDLDFAVYQGASSNTYQQFPYTSQSASALVFTIQCPSESVIINRELLIQSTVKFSITISGVATGVQSFNLGLTDALQAFPLNKLFQTLSASINNTNVSINSQDVLDSLLILNDTRELQRYNGMTPVLRDSSYNSYANAVLALNNPLSSYNNSPLDVDITPRGAFPVNFVQVIYTTGGTPTTFTNAAAFAATGDVISKGLTDQWVYTFTTKLTEPLILAPFIFGNPMYNEMGFAGISQITINATIDSTMKRFWSTSSAATTYTLALDPVQPFSSSQILCQFLSAPSTLLVPVKNVVPYLEYPRYTTTGSSPIASGASQTITSNNIQLNQIPDEFLISVRIPMSSQTPKNTASFFVINSISVNLNNASGLLSSSSQNDIFRLCVGNNSTQSWEEFSGIANINSNASGVGSQVATTGSLLILNPVKDLSLPETLSSSSLGQFNFQISMNITNPYAFSITPEIVIITVLGGIMSFSQGQAVISTGVLTREMVVSAKSKKEVDAISTGEYQRLIGGKMHHRGLATIGRMLRRHRHHHPHAGADHSAHPHSKNSRVQYHQ